MPMTRAILIGMAASLVACTNASDEQAFSSGPEDALVAPSRADYSIVGAALQPRCGTLDCHGQRGRNLRLYGARGLRLSESDDSSEGVTSADELAASYQSVVALEPERMSAVVRDGARHPEWLSVVRKPLGIEAHKGGQLMAQGDALHRCLVSWLAGALDAPACAEVASAPRPRAP
jgi:hypothetical protein